MLSEDAMLHPVPGFKSVKDLRTETARVHE